MSSAASKLFLVAFDRGTQDTEVIDLGSDAEVAMREYRAREGALLAGGRDVEVVLLRSDSEATLRRTHSSYFRQTRALADLVRRATA